MTPSQLRKLNVIIQKKMMSTDQLRLLITLMDTPTTTLTDLHHVYYGPRAEGAKITLGLSHIRKYLKMLILKLNYWGLPHIIVVQKDGTVTLREKPQEAEHVPTNNVRPAVR